MLTQVARKHWCQAHLPSGSAARAIESTAADQPRRPRTADDDPRGSDSRNCTITTVAAAVPCVATSEVFTTATPFAAAFRRTSTDCARKMTRSRSRERSYKGFRNGSTPSPRPAARAAVAPFPPTRPPPPPPPSLSDIRAASAVAAPSQGAKHTEDKPQRGNEPTRSRGWRIKGVGNERAGMCATRTHQRGRDRQCSAASSPSPPSTPPLCSKCRRGHPAAATTTASVAVALACASGRKRWRGRRRPDISAPTVTAPRVVAARAPTTPTTIFIATLARQRHRHLSVDGGQKYTRGTFAWQWIEACLLLGKTHERLTRLQQQMCKGRSHRDHNEGRPRSARPTSSAGALVPPPRPNHGSGRGRTEYFGWLPQPARLTPANELAPRTRLAGSTRKRVACEPDPVSEARRAHPLDPLQASPLALSHPSSVRVPIPTPRGPPLPTPPSTTG